MHTQGHAAMVLSVGLDQKDNALLFVDRLLQFVEAVLALEV